METVVPYKASGEKGGQLAGCFEGEDYGGGREQGKAVNCSTEVNVADVGRTEIPLGASRMEKGPSWSSPYCLLQVSFGLHSP